MEINPKLMTLLLAIAPVSELRGAIPYGILVAKLSVAEVFTLAFLGNLLPVIPLFFGIQSFLSWLGHFRWTRKFSLWFVERTKRKAVIIEYYKAIGLALFVAIPLPLTGVWTGTIAANLFKMKFKYMFLGTVLGVLIAGIIVTILTLSGSELFHILKYQ
ncbi:MAG: ligand-binding protein SH3 [bacterium (Candidatus Ratteibacteria) CG_4_10_14_3_um_filter_41_18]|uniref:Ligand-binding protein SH3 n=4 Tax=Candidatus Ratteibacteria TaxID=2979319 RepID=A0A2M7E6M2_9BACT|nr:MAG: hypothetical protein AUJ76_03550 [Candidatus Omnitrophica bacterium CG1_02_41_171]PIV63380.1 MAG: ligand-binding protein SH3 [bacterium (Candidatus Ratteibacteria) CG01_land_8_20_14_3_00_40_19]PIW32384.1 MAG: ligand-binding protein SH3 [bacterium (Candidatus Ratteibacteria) CG15_BIG_FIL_POST_REV_8_21_14_020_41_12]PIW74132.1 MAG: ligand-binding protein SH3 [bacterium (Candidatus Ratteibacteria) CG_4_8_14_3_um_filter_41_36]PIX76763.1 MAG: ligand-binding protein SH3 [bacterium (Candidatus 